MPRWPRQWRQGVFQHVISRFIEWVLSLLGFEDTSAGRRRFDAFVREVYLDDVPAQSQGAKARKAADPGWQARNGHRSPELPACDWEILWELAGRAQALTESAAVTSRTHTTRTVRRLMAVFCRRVIELPLTDIARQLGVSESAVHHLVHRSHPRPLELDAQLQQLKRLWEDHTHSRSTAAPPKV